MYWTENPLVVAATRSLCRIFLGLSLILTAPALLWADESTPAMEIWLVTYGPGEIYWQRFGHNAIWVRDQDLGLNHVFNFGFFDFEQEAFFRRFLLGKLWYFSAAHPAEREFSQYIDANRSIRAQRLNLSAEQSLRLTEYLLDEVQPENRDYLYDYYTNNCSTRVRDALDLALGGALTAEYEPIIAGQTWRDHTRRLSIDDFWLYLGLEIGLGSVTDRVISLWDEFFIPSELAGAMALARMGGLEDSQPLVLEDVMLFESSLQPVPLNPAGWWPRYLLMSILLLSAAWLACLLLPALAPMHLVRAWLLIGGLVGAALIFFWFFTDHQAARLNLNLLVFNPLWWLLAVWKQYRMAGKFLLFLSLLAMLMVFLPPQQYTLDVLAAILPLNIVSGLVLLRFRSQQASQPGVPAAADR